MNIIAALRSPKAFKPLFPQLETWRPWSVFLSGVFGLPIAAGPDLELFKKCTGLEQPPAGGAQEIFCLAGRRSGKSRIAALVGVYLACFCDWRKVLAKGERGKVMLIAVDRSQARVLRDYCGGILDAHSTLRSLVKQEGKESIELRNGVDIEIMTASYRTIRGRTVICGVLDEAAFFRADELSANPAREIYNALRPSMATVPGSKLIAISTAYAKEGLMYEARQRYFGQPGKTLAWVADSMTMNPTLDKAMIEEELSKDRAAASAEWLSIERSDLSTYVDGDLVGDLVVPDRFELPRMEGVSYVAFCDPAGGAGRDSMTMAVCHLEEGSGRIIQDAIRVQRPPFNPKACVQEFVKVLKGYGVGAVTGDKYSGDWCASTFREEGIDYRNSAKTKSELYLEFLPLLTQRRVELLDHARTVTEIRQLERKAGSGRDSVDHPKGFHDDCANVIAGAAVMVQQPSGAGYCVLRGWGPDEDDRDDKLPGPFQEIQDAMRRQGF
jgi:hypothetical protein